MQRLFLPVFVLIIMLGLSGCRHEPGENQPKSTAAPLAVTEKDNKTIVQDKEKTSAKDNEIVDSRAIISRQENNMKTINSCRSNIYLKIDINSSVSGSGNLSLVADMKSSIDIAKRRLNSQITTTLVTADDKNKTSTHIAASDNQVYMKTGGTGRMQGQWQVKNLTPAEAEKLWIEQQQQLTGIRFSQMLTADDFVYAGQEKYDGHNCLKFAKKFDFTDILNASPELSGPLQNMGSETLEKLQKFIRQADVVILIDEKSSYLREFRLDAAINSDVEGQKITGRIKQYCRYDGFNEDTSIKIPEAGGVISQP